MEKVWSLIEDNLNTALGDLTSLCRFPSISSSGKHMTETAAFVRSLLEEAGFQTKMLTAPRAFPSVFGEIKGRSNKTLLLYDHYDVMPPDPLDKWDSDPFEVTKKHGYLFGRGVSDNKGNIMARLLAIKALREIHGELPINIKFFIEGEEEIGSPNLESILRSNRELLKADGCVWEGGSKYVDGRPILYFGAKGLCYLELEAGGLESDLHSSMGGIIPNPVWRLVWALNSMKSMNGRINIKGFYDDIVDPGEEEKKAARELASMGEKIKKNYGLEAYADGMAAEDISHGYFFKPSFTICGFDAGYQGSGQKMVLPNRARAKVDFCLVPNQGPSDIVEKVKAHLAAFGFNDIEVKVLSANIRPGSTPIDHQFSKLMRSTVEKTYGVNPMLYPVMPSPGPYSWFGSFLGIPTVSIGIGHFKGNIHAPNENIKISDFLEGSKFIAALISDFPKMVQSG